MKYIKPFLKMSLKGADLVAGISRETVSAAKNIYNREIHIIPDGIDMTYYSPGLHDESILEKFRAKNKKVLFFTGRMVERKGHRYLLESIKYIKLKYPDIKLILGGQGPLFDELNKFRIEMGLEDHIEMPGFLPEEEIVPLLRSIFLYILPSCIDKNGDTEGSATAAFEAMACGTPAIISKVGGNINSIIDGQGAYYFEPGNSVDLAEKIQYLLSNGEIYQTNRLLARKYIQENYSWEKSIEKYKKLMEL